MTLRLSALFESQIKTLISNWKTARRRANKNKSRDTSSSPNKRAQSERTRSTGRRGNLVRNTRRIRNSEESSHNDEEDDDDGDNKQPRVGQRRGRIGQTRSGSGAATASASSSNRVSSSSHRRMNALDDSQPGTSRASRRKNASQELDCDDAEEEIEPTASSSDSDLDGDDTSSEESISDNSASENSEESYSPVKDRKQKGRKRHHHKSERKSNQSGRAKRRRRHVENDTDEDFDLDGHKNHKKSGRIGRKPNNGTRRVGGAVSQMDESTQDTLSNTPKKKGRPPKTPRNDDGPSTSSVLNVLMLQSPSRNTRNQIISQTTSVGVGRRAAENDHSYHLPVRNGRIIESDNDSREVAARPTRASVKRAIMEWARGSELEDGEGTEEAEEVSFFF